MKCRRMGLAMTGMLAVSLLTGMLALSLHLSAHTLCAHSHTRLPVRTLARRAAVDDALAPRALRGLLAVNFAV
jgi:hypothetical protein